MRGMAIADVVAASALAESQGAVSVLAKNIPVAVTAFVQKLSASALSPKVLTQCVLAEARSIGVVVQCIEELANEEAAATAKSDWEPAATDMLLNLWGSLFTGADMWCDRLAAGLGQAKKYSLVRRFDGFSDILLHFTYTFTNPSPHGTLFSSLLFLWRSRQ